MRNSLPRTTAARTDCAKRYCPPFPDANGLDHDYEKHTGHGKKGDAQDCRDHSSYTVPSTKVGVGIASRLSSAAGSDGPATLRWHEVPAGAIPDALSHSRQPRQH